MATGWAGKSAAPAADAAQRTATAAAGIVLIPVLPIPLPCPIGKREPAARDPAQIANRSLRHLSEAKIENAQTGYREYMPFSNAPQSGCPFRYIPLNTTMPKIPRQIKLLLLGTNPAHPQDEIGSAARDQGNSFLPVSPAHPSRPGAVSRTPRAQSSPAIAAVEATPLHPCARANGERKRSPGRRGFGATPPRFNTSWLRDCTAGDE